MSSHVSLMLGGDAVRSAKEEKVRKEEGSYGDGSRYEDGSKSDSMVVTVAGEV